MDISHFPFKRVYNYKGYKTLYFDFDISESAKRRKTTFVDYKSLLYFIEDHPDKKICITSKLTNDFHQEGDLLVLNLVNYQSFCKTLGQSGRNRAHAFFARRIQSFTDQERQEFINGSSIEQITLWLENLPTQAKQIFIKKVMSNDEYSRSEVPDSLTTEEFSKVLASALIDPQKQEIIALNYSRGQIKTLEDHKQFIQQNLDKNEDFIQRWIDGKIDNMGNMINLSEQDIVRLQKSRRLIFGLEFTSHEREVLDSGQRMDILARINPEKNRREYTLFELKAPSAKIFEQIDSELKLSERISRAIPQVLDYKEDFENKKDGDADLARRNLPAGKIVKCIILIGTRNENERANKIFRGLKDNFSNLIEIWTYTDLINRLETTISNLKENL